MPAIRVAPTHMNATKSGEPTDEARDGQQPEGLVERLDGVLVLLAALFGHEDAEHEALEDPDRVNFLPVGHLANVRHDELDLVRPPPPGTA